MNLLRCWFYWWLSTFYLLYQLITSKSLCTSPNLYRPCPNSIRTLASGWLWSFPWRHLVVNVALLLPSHNSPQKIVWLRGFWSFQMYALCWSFSCFRVRRIDFSIHFPSLRRSFWLRLSSTPNWYHLLYFSWHFLYYCLSFSRLKLHFFTLPTLFQICK